MIGWIHGVHYHSHLSAASSAFLAAFFAALSALIAWNSGSCFCLSSLLLQHIRKYKIYMFETCLLYQSGGVHTVQYGACMHACIEVVHCQTVNCPHLTKYSKLMYINFTSLHWLFVADSLEQPGSGLSLSYQYKYASFNGTMIPSKSPYPFITRIILNMQFTKRFYCIRVPAFQHVATSTYKMLYGGHFRMTP